MVSDSTITGADIQNGTVLNADLAFDGTFTEDDAEEFTDALAAGLLDDIYSLI